MRILLVEDDSVIAEGVREGLEEAGFEVDVAPDGTAGLRLARDGGYALLILDLMLPGMDGWELCSALRARRVTTPILMLTARDALDDRVRGLEAEADDYLPKPFQFPELLARVRAQLRRDKLHRARVIRIADLEIDTNTRRVRRAGEEFARWSSGCGRRRPSGPAPPHQEGTAPNVPAPPAASAAGGEARDNRRRGSSGGGFRFVDLLPNGRWAPLPEGRGTLRRRSPPTGAESESRGFPGQAMLFDVRGQPNPLFPDQRPWDATVISAAARGQELFSTVTEEGESVRVFTAPLRRAGAIVGILQAAQPLGEQQRLAESQFRTLLHLLPLALLVPAVGGFFLTNRALRPVSEVTRAAAQIGAEDLSRRLQVTGKDELATLAATFNEMIARLEEAFRGQAEAYRRLERAYEEQRRFTADASHELRTPLTQIMTRTSLALSGPATVERYGKALAVADQAAQGMNRIVQDLLFLARTDAGQLPLQRTTCGVRQLFQEAVEMAAAAGGAPIQIEVAPADLEIEGDPHHLTRLLVNLLQNAVRHTPVEGQITLTGTQEAGLAVLTVADTGEGIPPEHLPHVCDRFYRVDAARTATAGGTGLGLAICRSIVALHGGTLSLRSEPGRGTTVEVRLPSAVPAGSDARLLFA